MSRRHQACPPCRLSKKDGGPDSCPSCGNAWVEMGKNFRPPKHGNKVQWKKIELAVMPYGHSPHCSVTTRSREDTLYLYYGCECGWLPDFQTPADVKSKRGLRRSAKKNWAQPPKYRGRAPAGFSSVRYRAI